jgi:hypothetical protein
MVKETGLNSIADAMRKALHVAVGAAAPPTPDESNEAEDMVSLRTQRTGVDNTIFVSTKGYARHAPRIKIAVDPPHTLNATSKMASMAIHDSSITGADLPPYVVEQAKQFIERNRDTLLRYWDYEIDTDEMIKQLK